MKKLLKAVLFLIVIIGVVSLLPVHSEGEIYESVLRLHVLANSDSEEDQSLKLKVRDAILEVSEPLLKGCESRDDAARVMSENAELLEQTALEVIRAEGYSYFVNISIGLEDYPRRNYEKLCFPAGEYLSLKVEIGEAEGKNWWCVLFPPLCLSASSTDQKQSAEDAFISVGLTEDQYKIITESDNVKYRARFKILEVLETIFG